MQEKTQRDWIDVEARLRAAFLAPRVDDSAMKAAVCAYVDEKKKLGWAPERVILEIKRFATAEGSFIFRARFLDHTALAEAEGITSRAVTWCIEHYFWTGRA